MREFLGPVFALAWKDILLEIRTRDIVVSVLVFAFLVVVVFNFALNVTPRVVDDLAPGILWVAFAFAGILAMNRAFVLEKDRGSLEGLLLTPVSRDAIYFGKMLGTFLFMLVVEAVLLPVFAVLFNFSAFSPGLILAILLATLGFAAVGTLFSAIAVQTRSREIMLPVLFLPIIVPVIIAAVESSAGSIGGGSAVSVGRWLGLIAVFDAVFFGSMSLGIRTSSGGMIDLERGGSERLAERRVFESKAPSWAVSAALLTILLVLMLVDIYLIFMWAPTDAILGHVQRIFYFHVPIAWVAFLSFFIVFVSSILYLWKRSARWDALAHSAAEIGLVFATLILITGSIWARPVWGVWWTWEPKLTTSLILWLIYVGYLMLRAYAPNRAQGATYAAVLGIVGFIDVPIVYFAVEWWRAVHPESVVGPLAEPGSLDSSMRAVLMFSLLTFTLLFAFLLRERVSLRTMEDTLRSARYSVENPGNY